MLKLDNRGFSHDLLLIFLVLVFAIGGIGFVVMSHADVTATGTVAAWGRNDVGDLGQGYKGHGSTQPLPIRSLSGVTSVAANYGGNLALLKDGTVRVWGGNTRGQLAQGNQVDSYAPETVPGLSGTVAKAIDARSSHDMVLMNDGTVYVWGANGHGTTGNGTVASHKVGARCLNCAQFVPYHIPNLANVVAISAGGTDDMVLLKDGTVMAWGDNTFGQLGYDPATFTNPYTPVVVPGLSNVKQVVAGENDDYAVLKDGTVMAWGDNNRGQLGNGSVANGKSYNYIPTPVQGLTNVVSMASGDAKQNLAVLSNGTVMAWGFNNNGQLGIGNKAQNCSTGPHSQPFSCSPVPVQISGLSNVTQVSAGAGFSEAISGGKVYSWGINDHTTLGSGNRISTDVPGPVVNLSGVTQVSAGNDHSLALH